METEQLTKVKKILYKYNPTALLIYATKNGLLYSAETVTEEGVAIAIMFLIPLADLGDAKFSIKMDSKHLIRWINTVNIIPDN